MDTEPITTASGLIELIVAQFERGGVAYKAWLMGASRLAPTILLVPAFGLRATLAPVRVFMTLALATCVSPVMQRNLHDVPFGYGFLLGVLEGLPIAIAAAVPLWAATMVGGIIDAARGTSDTVLMPVVEGQSSVLGVAVALLASLFFLASGGPARVISALAKPRLPFVSYAAQAGVDLVVGIQMAINIAVPILAASVIVEVSGALIAKTASPAQIHSLLAPVRSFAMIAIAAIALHRMMRLIQLWIMATPN